MVGRHNSPRGHLTSSANYHHSNKSTTMQLKHKFLLLNFVGLLGLMLILLTAHSRIITSIQIQTIDGMVTLLHADSQNGFGGGGGQPHSNLVNPVEVDNNNPQQLLPLKEGPLMARILSDAQVKFEPEAECIQKKLELKKSVGRAMGNFTCSVFAGRNQEECVALEKEAEEFFTDEKVLQRVLNPHTYFQRITTVAFKQLTHAEETTPFAYSILNHSNLGLLEALLSVIFRPHNSYCIYVDAKASDQYKASVAKLLNVYRYNFPSTTIIMANPTLRIYWSGVSILEAGLDCMEQLLKANTKWKYFFNSIGTALPGMPIQDIAEIVSKLEGDVVASVSMTDFIRGYQTHKYLLPKEAEKVNFDSYERGGKDVFLYHEEHLPYKTTIRKMRPPRGIVPYYNMTESVLSRSTAHFLLYNQVAKEFRSWVQDVKAPEEFFYATLARIDQSSAENPGRFSVVQDFHKDTTQGICPRFSNWNETTCHGLMKRWICNFSMGDVPTAVSSKCIWMNKFDLHVDSHAVACVREYLVR